MFQKGEIVFAKCGTHPAWPCRIISTNTELYRVSFIGEKTYAFVNVFDVYKFTEQKIMQSQCLKNKKLNHAIQIALKDLKLDKSDEMKSSNNEIVQNNNVHQINVQQAQNIEDNRKKINVANNAKKISPNLNQHTNYNSNNYTNYYKSNRSVTELLSQCDKLLENLLDDLIRPLGQQHRQEDEYQKTRLQEILQSDKVNARTIIQGKQIRILQKIIMCLKAYNSFEYDCQHKASIMLFLKQKYEQYHNQIIKHIDEYKTTMHRKMVVLEKLKNFKACT